MIIRPATIDDAPALCEYAARLFSEDLPGIFRRPVPTLNEEVTFIRQRIETATSTLLVAEEDGVPVGLADLLGATTEEERHTGTFGISVDRDWRGRGVGTALIEALLEWASAHGITRIQAFAWETNPRALQLYERLGFVREGVCRRAVVRDGMPIDVVMIARLLDEEAVQ